jgi:hypothetical protein
MAERTPLRILVSNSTKKTGPIIMLKTSPVIIPSITNSINFFQIAYSTNIAFSFFYAMIKSADQRIYKKITGYLLK